MITIALACMLLAACGRDARLPDPIPAASLADFPGNTEPPLLVDAAWLSNQIAADDPSLVILDASDLATYRAGHIPGAVHAWWQDTMNPNELFFGGVLKPEENDPDPQLMRRHFIADLGVTPQSTIVIYDNARGLWASRFVWTLRFLGYPNAAMLDGGLGAWRGAGGELDTATRDANPAPNPPIAPLDGYYVFTDRLIEMLVDPNLTLLDVRTDAEARDTIDDTIEPGRIPNAISLPWTESLADDSGRLLPPDVLLGLFQQQGVTPDRTIVIYARFGVETAQTWLTLKLLGYPNVLIYDGGWVDWAANPATPKAPLD